MAMANTGTDDVVIRSDFKNVNNVLGVVTTFDALSDDVNDIVTTVLTVISVCIHESMHRIHLDLFLMVII